MRHLIIIFALILASAPSQSQILKTEADTAFLLDLVHFPPIDATHIPIFHSSMLDPHQKSTALYQWPVDSLLKQIEAQPENAVLNWELAQYYAGQQEALISDYYTEEALKFAVLDYEENRGKSEQTYLLAEIYTRLGDTEGLQQIWDEYTLINPHDAKGWTALAWLALETGEKSEDYVQQLLDKAYECNPTEPEVYATAYWQQLSRLIDKIVDAKGQPVDYWDVDDRFFQTAMRENPSLEVPRMGFYALRLATLMFESMLAKPQLSTCFDLDQLWFGMTKMGAKQAEGIEKYMKDLLARDWENKAFPLRCLAMLDILKGDMSMAQNRISEMEDYSGYDREMYRLLALGYFPASKWDSAAHYLYFAQEIEEDLVDYLEISMLHFQQKDYEKAGNVFLQNDVWARFEPYTQMGDFSAHYAVAAINLKSRNFENYCQLMARLHQAIALSEVRPQREAYYLWYVSLAAILVGDEQSAKKGLSQLRKSDYEHLRKWSDDLWYRFFLD